MLCIIIICSAPEKPLSGKDVHRVGAFVQQYGKDKSMDTDDIPFMSLLQQNKPEQKPKADPGKAEAPKAVSSAKTDGFKTDTSDSALSESKTSVSSQASAPDDFVMVELVSVSRTTMNQSRHVNILTLKLPITTIVICFVICL